MSWLAKKCKSCELDQQQGVRRNRKKRKHKSRVSEAKEGGKLYTESDLE